MRNYNLDKLESDIEYQLSERTIFVKPEDQIVGNIFFDLGNILALKEDLQIALKSYAMAKKYGFQNKLMVSRVEKLESIIWNAQTQEIILSIGILILFLAIISFFTFLLIKRKKNSLGNKGLAIWL